MKNKKKQFNTRLRVVFGGIIFIGFVLITNLFHIQIQLGKELRAKADGQYVVSTYNSFERGNIFFEGKNGLRTLAAGQKKGYKISINPSKLEEYNINNIYNNINKIHEIDKNKFIKAASKKNRKYIEVAHHVSKKNGDIIMENLGKDISLYEEKWRVYPLQKTSAQLIGFLGFDDENNFGGRYGLERYYNQTLNREDKELYTNFFARVFHGVQDITDSEKKQEGNIITSIDLQVQLFFEKELMSIQKKWNSRMTGGIIMDPKTGEIIAMSTLPSFDNNNFRNESISLFKNPLVSNVYEFGSVIKPLVVAIGLDQGLINSKSEYYDKGFVSIGKYTINNFDKKGRGWVTVQDILNQSLNTGMVFISKKIPKQSFREYFKKYGFGEKSGIDLPNDSSGITSNLKSNRDIEFANMSFGQGIAISPISFIKSLSALANNGKTVIPHIVKKIEYTNGFSKTLDYKNKEHRVLKEETSGEISRILVNVFDAYRKGKVKFPNHSVAAKTGTAQIPAPNGAYYSDRNLHTFFGYFPAYNPKFIILMYTVYPKKIKYASQTLIEPFRNTAKYLINYYNIPPDR